MGSSASTLAATLDAQTLELIKAEHESKKETMTEEELKVHMDNFIANMQAAATKEVDELVNGLPEQVASKLKLQLWKTKDHVLQTTLDTLTNICKAEAGSKSLGDLTVVDDVSGKTSSVGSVVTANDNFGQLLFPNNHFATRYTDVYYLNDAETVGNKIQQNETKSLLLLRTHLLAHVAQLFKTLSAVGFTEQYRSAFACGDIYKKLEEDESNAEFSHEALVFCVKPLDATAATGSDDDEKAEMKDLKTFSASVITKAFSSMPAPPKHRWEEFDDLPFCAADNVVELQVQFNDAPLQVAYGGVFTPEFLAELSAPKAPQPAAPSTSEVPAGTDAVVEGSDAVVQPAVAPAEVAADIPPPVPMCGFFVCFSLERMAMVLNNKANIKEVQLPVPGEKVI